MVKPIEGVFAYSVTPTGADDSIDFAAWKSHVDWMITEGVSGITLFGSTGSNGFFTEAEKMRVFDEMISHISGRVAVQAGVGSMTTGESVRLAKYAAKSGADAVLVVPLNYWKPTETELLTHYKSVAEASVVPVWVYNNPGLAGIDLKPETIAKIAKSSNVVGMKDSSGDLTRVFTVPKLTNGQVKVGIGQDTLVLEAVGASPAWFTGLGNFVPKDCAAFWKEAKADNTAAALKLGRKLYELAELGGRYGIVRVAHSALSLMGKPAAAGPRAPLQPLAGPAREELAEAMKRSGAL